MEPKPRLFPSLTSSPYEPNNSSSSSSSSSFETFSTSTAYLPIDESYSPPRSSPIPIPFSPPTSSLRFEIYSSSPLPTKLAQPFIIRPFKAHLEKVRDLLGYLQLSIGSRSQSRIVWSLESLSSLDLRISRTICDVLTRLALGEGECMMLDYLRWVREMVKECHGTLELVKEREIGWEAYVKSQLDFNLRTAINSIGLADSGATFALLESLKGWDSECASAVEMVLFSNVLNNEERIIEIKRIQHRITSRQTIFPVDDQPPTLSIPQLSFLLAPIPSRAQHSPTSPTPSTLPLPLVPAVASLSSKTVAHPPRPSSNTLSNLTLMIAQSDQSTLINATSETTLLGEKKSGAPSSLDGEEMEDEDEDEDDEDSEPPSFAEYDADDLSSNDNTDSSSSSNTTLNSTPTSQTSLEEQLLAFPTLLHHKTISLLLGRQEEDEEGNTGF